MISARFFIYFFLLCLHYENTKFVHYSRKINIIFDICGTHNIQSEIILLHRTQLKQNSKTKTYEIGV